MPFNSSEGKSGCKRLDDRPGNPYTHRTQPKSPTKQFSRRNLCTHCWRFLKMADNQELLFLVVYRRCWPTREWVHEIIKRREELSEFHPPVQEIRLEKMFSRCFTNVSDNFLHIVGVVPTTNYRKPK